MLFISLLCFVLYAESTEIIRPHIILFIADDLGWNDVSFHGSNQIPTPNLDALAYSGLILEHHYVAPICTPSRAALMTGKYPIHTGMQHGVIYGTEPRGLPLTEKLLPQHLKDLGYINHLVGKWHLGNFKKEYLPLNRGFDSHLGFWVGKIDMYDHTNMEKGSWGFDFRRGYETANEFFGKYATNVYTEEAIRIIKNHDKSKPMFLMVAHSAMHSGNPNEPIRAPDQVIDKYKYIVDYQRRKYAAVLSELDKSVGEVFSALHNYGLLNNSIILFSSDNGGPAAGFNDNAASNYPLRGVKNTLWEGGVRGASALWSPFIQKKSRVATQRVHISDWLPTLYSAAGGNVSALGDIDGIDQWAALSENTNSSRNTIVHNIDDVWGSAAITVDQWKLHKGTNYGGNWDKWYGPSGRGGSYNISLIAESDIGRIVKSLGHLPSDEVILDLREKADIKCKNISDPVHCNPLTSPCLFNIDEDPCEERNLAELEPEILQRLLKELRKINETAVAPNNKEMDPNGDPKYWGRVYTNFADFNLYNDITKC